VQHAAPKEALYKYNNDLEQFNASISVSQYSHAQAQVEATRRRKNQIKAILEDRLTDTMKSVVKQKKNPQAYARDVIVEESSERKESHLDGLANRDQRDADDLNGLGSMLMSGETRKRSISLNRNINDNDDNKSIYS
jgi:hypothetical protein